MITLRPRKARVVSAVAAGAVLIVFTLVASALTGPINSQSKASFGTGDRVAMVLLGVLAALAVLSFARPRVEADAEGIRIRNIVGRYDLPWSAVRQVRFHGGAPWASLELVDDEMVAVMAVQATDKEYAVDGVRALRELHAAATSGAPGTPARPEPAVVARPAAAVAAEPPESPESPEALDAPGRSEVVAEAKKAP